MPIDFHAEKNRQTYASRNAAADWNEQVRSLVDPAGKKVIDLGCGGGIYSKAWVELGAASVLGVDFSLAMLAAAEENCRSYPQISFRHGDAVHTGLPDGCADILFVRALIHHLQDLPGCFAEAFRLLVPGGLVMIQDRTPDDVSLPGSLTHFRGYFFECFPRLRKVEADRRPGSQAVREALEWAGFTQIAEQTMWETRRTYAGFAELAEDLRKRTGRSLLHELSDGELEQLIDYLKDRLPTEGPVVEKDRWTIWVGARA